MDDTSLPGAPEPGSAPIPTEAPVAPDGRSTIGRSIKYAALFALAALLGTTLFIGGYLAAGGGSGSSSCSAPSDAFEAFCEAYDKLHAEYVDELDDDQLVEGALEGLFQYGVADPYSGYMSAEEYQQPRPAARALARAEGLAEPGQVLLLLAGFKKTPAESEPSIAVLHV